jgi:ligand-binding sensor domain-containing protein
VKRLTHILVCYIIPLWGSAQQYYTRTFTIDDGLPSNQINCLYQDNVGYLWIGTDAGIAIFDGIGFRILNKKDGLASNDVRAITQDIEGNYWIACYDGGVTKFNGQKFFIFNSNNGLRSNFIRRAYYSKTFETLFIGADDGFYTMKDDKLTFYGEANGKLSEEHEVLWFMEGKGFVYIFPYLDNLYKFYPSTGSLTHLVGEKSEQNGKWWAITSALVTSKNDTVWGNKFAISDHSGYRRLPVPKGGLVFSISEDNDGNIWLPIWSSQTGGILRYNGSRLEDYTSTLGLDGIKCKTTLYDKNTGTLWIGTDGKGLVSVPRKVFTNYSTREFLGEKREYRKLFYYKKSTYILYDDKIVKFDPSAKKEEFPIGILENSNARKLIQSIRYKHRHHLQILNTEFWRAPAFYDVAKDNQGNLWISSTVGFFRLSPDLKSVTKDLLIDTRYGRIEFDLQNNLYNWGFWLNSLDFIPDPTNQRAPYKTQKYSGANVDLPKEITNMIPIGSDMLFSSVYGGLYLYNGIIFNQLNKNNPELPDNISDVCKDQDGNIVFCTNTAEIGIGYIQKGKFIQKRLYDSLDESYGRNFIWVICDKQHNIYAGTNKGMLVIHYSSVLSSQSQSIRFYSKSEGYDDFGVTSPVLDDEGNIWLASQNNIIQIDTKAISPNIFNTPKIILTKLETTDSNYVFNERSGASSKVKWRFSHNSNNLTFHFNNINLLNPEKDRFSVQLEGFDGEIKDIGSDRKATYTNLPAGKYRYVVRVYNLNTLQKQSSVLLEFIIRPPYWQTWWFYMIMSLILIILFLLIYKARIKRIRKETETQLEFAELEMKALQALMNPHFVFNVMNSLQRYILERDARKGIQLLANFSNMIRQTFSFSSKKFITLQEEITYLESYIKLEQERFTYKFRFEISADDTLNLKDVLIPSMLVQPLVENAVKHGLSPMQGNDGLLIVSFKTDDNNESLNCIIEDNGIGLNQSIATKQENKTNLSQALSITQRRIELFSRAHKSGKYKVTVSDRSTLQQTQTGTRVEITLPIQTF